MTSNNNKPQKGSGANQPDKKQSIDSDAANVDWMIMSDFSTRIGGYPEPQKVVNNLSTNTSAQSVNKQSDDDDLEDLEWLRSLGLDEPIENSTFKKNVVSASQNSNAGDDIDWLIVSDIKTRMDDPDNIQPKSGYQEITPSNKSFQVSEEFNGLENPLDEDFGLDSLGFDEDADFDGLNSFGFDNSENATSNELQNDLDITEGKIRELSGFFENSFDADNASSSDWDNDFGDLENNDSQFSSYSNLGLIEDSFEAPIEISGIVNDTSYSNESNQFNDYFADDAALIPNNSPEFTYQEDLQVNPSVGLLIDPSIDDLSPSELLADDLIEEFNIEELDDEFQDLQDVIEDSQDLATVEEIAEINDLSAEQNNSVDSPEQAWDEFQLSGVSDLDVDAIDDVFAGDWEQNDQNDQSSIAITDDAIWDSPAIVADSISSTSIDNAFGTLDDWAIAPQTENVLEQPVEPKIDLIDSQLELEPQIDNEADWANDADLGIAVDDDFEWNQESELAINAAEESPFTNALIENQIHEEFDFGGMEQSLEWDSETLNEPFREPFREQISEQISEQITDSDFADDFTNDAVKSVETINSDNSDNSEKNNVITAQDSENPENFDDFANLDSIINEDFDLDAFDEEDFPEVSLTDTSNNRLFTTLTPNRAIPVPTPSAKNLTSGITPPPVSAPLSVTDSRNNLVSPDFSATDPFEEALIHDLQNNEFINDYDLEVNLHEEALANDLLNGDMSDSEVLANRIPERGDFLPPPPQIPPNLPLKSPSNLLPNLPSKLPLSESFDMDTNDRDFLDDFDLDSLDTQLTGDDFGSAFVPPAISTGLTPPSPPIAPLPPSMNTQDMTAPSVNNPPPPPPFLPPLPPKRSPAQAKKTSVSPPIQNKPASKPIGSLDEGWSELLDADTVLSGVLRSPTGGSPYVEPRGAMPPHTAGKTGASAANNGGTNAARPSQGRERDYNSSTPPKRKDTGLPDFNDLGLEIHDDTTDWSGLLDSSDLSDSITSISEGNQSSSRNRTPPLVSRSELTGIGETREIPRDRRKPVSGFDATQARMAARSDQIDFNRFTEDNYEPPAMPSEVATPAKKLPKISMPSVSLESLWQDYLKIPVIGLGAIGGAFLLYTFLNRPIFDIGLRWGIFKDASGKDFTKADFKGAKLDNVDFSNAILTGAKMQDASLVGANFTNANLDGVNFTNANLSRARLIQASVVWAEFSKAQMNLVDLEGADLTLSNFANAKMEGANLLKSKIGAQGTDKATKFSSTMLLAWQIVNEQREGRNLAEQDLSGLNLSFTSLKRANLSNAKLNYTDLTGTDLRGANLTGSQVNGANWSGAKLAGINLTGVNFDKNKLPKTDEETICPNSKKGPCKF